MKLYDEDNFDSYDFIGNGDIGNDTSKHYRYSVCNEVGCIFVLLYNSQKLTS